MLAIPGYQVLTKIHESNFSQVYRGKRSSDQLPMIFKVLKKSYPGPEEITRYKLEYEITRSLAIEGVAQAYDLQQHQATFVIFLEDFGGESLEKLRALRSFSLSEILQLSISITHTLGQIHAKNIVHKDINPSNIVLNPETSQLKIIDFGISTLLPQEKLVLQHPQILEGTLAFMSPEQTGRMNRSLDYRTDFYSLGVTLYYLLTRQLPFLGNDPLELVHCHIAVAPTPPHLINSEIPASVSEIVMKLLEKIAENRYQSAWGIQADLEQCLQQLTSTHQITPFSLAQQDYSHRFQIPEKLYGRDQEVDELLSAFKRMVKGNSPTSGAQIVLVSGYSGIGKSALVHEIYKPITQNKGYFISGKFDQYQRNIPYFAIAQAISELVKQLLTESEAQLSQWHDRLQAALKQNGQVITKVIPDLEIIVGKQPEVPPLPPAEAQNQFHLIFQNLIQGLAQPDHPLVLFLDDLQWADAGSLKLIKRLATAPDLPHLLLIGAYRSNEVSSAHPLVVMLEAIQADGVALSHISLSPLRLPDIHQLIAETLRSQPEDSLPLAELVQARTDGNPFFINEFLKSLYANGRLILNVTSGTWHWSLSQIQALGITDNVVDLVASRFQKLNQPVVQTLQVAACIGNQFELETLAVAVGGSETQQTVALRLRQAIAAGLILPLSNSYKSVELDVPLPAQTTVEYRFAHDRIQQTAYSLIPEARRRVVHLQVGQQLLQQTSLAAQEQRIFDITNQLNLGRELLQTQTERHRLAELNQRAGEKAKASAAYDSAFNYCQIGLELLAPVAWQTNYDLTLALYNLGAETSYLTGRFDQMEHLTQVVLTQAQTLADKMRAYGVKIQSYAGQMQFLEALQIGLQALESLGVQLPSAPTPEEIQVAFAHTAFKLVGRQIEALIELPPMTDAIASMSIQLLADLIAPAYQAAPPLFPLLILEMVNLSLDHGNHPLSAFAYTGYSNILGCIVLDIDQSYQFVQLALNLLEQAYNPLIWCRTTFMANTSVRFRKIHLKETIQPLLDAYQLGIETGDIEFAGYSILHHCDHCFFTGMPLLELERKLAGYIQALTQMEESTNANALRVYQQTILHLIHPSSQPGLLIGEVYDESQGLPLLQAANHHKGLFYLYFNKLLLCYYFQDFQQAVDCANQADQYPDGGIANAVFPLFYFYDSLARLMLYSEVTPEAQTMIWERVTSNQEKLQLWAHHAPTNFRHKWHLVEAERYRVLGQVREAMEAYDLAITLANQHNYLQEEALANELAARFYLNRFHLKVARVYLQDACYSYQLWGAMAKVQDLERRYPQLLEGQQRQTSRQLPLDMTSASSSLEVLDLTSIIKAAQTVTSEILLDKLLVGLMQVLIENAGAQTGCLLLLTQGEWRIEAVGSVDQAKVAILQSIALELLEFTDDAPLPSAIIHYVARTGESVVLDHAAQEGIFQTNPWIVQHQSKSILCVPLLNQRELVGIVYLENSLVIGAFTPARLEIVQLVSAQAAISIHKARLLKHQAELNESLKVAEFEIRQLNAELEQRVMQRTAQLEAANTELEAFSYSVSHDLRAPLRAIDGFLRILQEDYSLQLDTTGNRYLEIVRANAKRMGELIDDLLQLSRLNRKEIHRQPVSPNVLIQRVLRDLAPDLEMRQVEFAIAQLPLCQGDFSLLQQVWINLLSNAIKYTRHCPVAEIEIDYLESNGETVYFIRDNGAGFDMQYANNLFGVFQRLHSDREFEGTGIGLAIVQRIIHRHGGQIWAEAAVNQGATFYFTLAKPLSDG